MQRYARTLRERQQSARRSRRADANAAFDSGGTLDVTARPAVAGRRARQDYLARQRLPPPWCALRRRRRSYAHQPACRTRSGAVVLRIRFYALAHLIVSGAEAVWDAASTLCQRRERLLRLLEVALPSCDVRQAERVGQSGHYILNVRAQTNIRSLRLALLVSPLARACLGVPLCGHHDQARQGAAGASVRGDDADEGGESPRHLPQAHRLRSPA